MLRALSLLFLTLTLTGCGVFFDTDNAPKPTPLTPIKTQVTPQLLWSTSTGNGGGSENLTMTPAIDDYAIYTSNVNGTITAINKTNGTVKWHANTKVELTSGPGVGNGVVVSGGRKGEIVAVDATTGQVRWKQKINSQILANPAIKNEIVLIKSVDGYVYAYNSHDGKRLWSIQQTEPTLILRGASAPIIDDSDAIIGFANGRLIKVKLSDGRTIWSHALAFPSGAFTIERMIDIDADPVVYGHRVFAATYQGKIASLSFTSGNVLWSHDLSTYTGMATDGNNLFVSDAKSYLYSFNADSGLVNWRLDKLKARHLSGPASISNYIVVGDAEGYLHWINKQDGQFASRTKVSGAIVAAPIANHGIVYVLTNNGHLMAYKLS